MGVEGGACLLSVPLHRVVLNVSEPLSERESATFPLWPPEPFFQTPPSEVSSSSLLSLFTPLPLLPFTASAELLPGLSLGPPRRQAGGQ